MKPVSVEQLVDRRAWTPEEDDGLREIVADRKVQNWTTVAQLLQDEYGGHGRTAKQCKDRWANQLDPSLKNETWSAHEEKRLFELHNAYGNKWAKISELLPGRTDNSIKNHFYCTLRKALRRVNRYIAEQRHKTRTRQIKNSILSKIIAVAEERFESKLEVPAELIGKCNDIKNRLIQFSKDVDLNSEAEQQLRKIISDIVEFNRAYKKKKTKKKIKDGTGSKAGKNGKDSDEQSDEEEDEKADTTNNGAIVPEELPLPPTQIKMQKPAPPDPKLQIVNYFKDHPEPEENEKKLVLSKSLEFDMEVILRGGPTVFQSELPMVDPGSPPAFFDDPMNPPSPNNPFSQASFKNPFATFPETPKFQPIVIKSASQDFRKQQE